MEECQELIEESEDIADVATVEIRAIGARIKNVEERMATCLGKMVADGADDTSSPLHSKFRELNERMTGLSGMIEQLERIEDNYFY